jgi:hypothetical protein
VHPSRRFCPRAVNVDGTFTESKNGIGLTDEDKTFILKALVDVYDPKTGRGREREKALQLPR